jgi:hypothetical protein
MEDNRLLLNNHLSGGKVYSVAYTAKKEVEILGFALAENEIESWCVFPCKGSAHPCAVVQKTLRTVEITWRR